MEQSVETLAVKKEIESFYKMIHIDGAVTENVGGSKRLISTCSRMITIDRAVNWICLIFNFH